MSEITTGAVSLSLISLPLAIGAVVLGSAYFAGKYCIKQYEKRLKDITATDERLKWLDKNTISSPQKMASEAKKLRQQVIKNSAFSKMTKGLSKTQKEILAGVIATENGPLKSYVPSLLENLPETNSVFDKALKQGVKSLAFDSYSFVNKAVKATARATGFTENMKILRQKNNVLDMVFTDKLGRKFAAYCKIDKELNPSLALDLEGFDCNNNECSMKMNEIINYLQYHGVPFKYKRLRHNQPMGVLRNLIEQKEAHKRQKVLENYLHKSHEIKRDKIKQS